LRSVSRRALTTVVLALVALVLTGCGGSQLDPGYAVSANAAVAGQLAGRTAAGGADPADPGGPTPSDGPVGPTSDASPVSSPLAGLLHTSAGGSGHGGAAAAQHVSCAGFRDQTGVTDSTVTIANVADVSGPVPGIFTAAQQATKAYVAYFNATSSLCGRKLAVLPLDSRTDAGGDLVAYTKACAAAFAAVGSMSAFDTGGAATAQKCGLPDIRTAAVSDARNACSTCFGVQATDLHAFQNAVPDFLLAHYPEASRHAAMIYVNEAASVQNARVMLAAEEKRGISFAYESSFDIAEFNYAAYVQRMKDKGVRVVQFVGSSDQAVRLGRAMQAAGFEPDVFLLDPTAYDPTFVRGGSAVDGAMVFIDFTPLEEASSSAELRLYLQWLHQVSPDAVPSYFGMFAWSATRLFVEQATALGGRLTRANLVSRMRQVHGWTDRGLHAPQDVGGKVNSNCWRFLQLHDGTWRPVGATHYLCRGATEVG
jgi:ABC-type branched-subunit amino acid transport system substrate-binding protein